jgi:hypothetical protein
MRWRIILLVVGLTACSSDEKPKNLIDESTMANIMTDIHLIESEINNLRLQHIDSSVFIYQKLKVKMLKKYNTDTAVFNASFKYYILNPDKMKPIYAEVKKKLEEAKKKNIIASKQKPKPKLTQAEIAKKKNDSIEAVLHRPSKEFIEKMRLKGITEGNKKKILHSFPENSKKNRPTKPQKLME